METEIVFYFNKKRLFFLLIICFLIVLLGLYIFLAMDNWEFSLFHIIPINKTFLGLLLILFFSILIVLLARKLKINKPAIIIGKDNIVEYSSSKSVGEINWDQITDLNVLTVSGNKMILLKVNNPQNFIDRFKSGITKKILEINLKNNGSPIVISAAALNCSFEELFGAINSRIKK